MSETHLLDVAQCARARYVDVERIRRRVDEGPYDAIVALAPENVPYFSGFYNMDLRIVPERLHMVVWPRGGDPAFVVMARRAGQLTPADTFVRDIRGYEGEGTDMMRALAEVMSDRGVTTGTVGIEGRSFPGGYLLDLGRRLPGLAFEDAYQFLESIRAVKTPAERDTLIRGNRITAEAINKAFRSARPGETERVVAARMQYELLVGGADQINAPLFAAGARSGIWHGLPTDQRIEDGMVVKTDFGGFFDGYFSDIARTAVMGKASDRQRDIHAKITEVKDRIVDFMKPGRTAAEVAVFGRRAYEATGLEYKWHILGHCIGLAVHEAPQIYPWVDEPLEAGMLLMIEVGYSDFPRDSFHVEDLVEVTATGAAYLTDASEHASIWELGR
jgi:Xaa-Pro aminopeptidase